MMQVIDPKRFDAFVQLLSLPDPADLPRRGRILRCEGDPDRRTTRLPAILMGWLQRRYLEIDLEEATGAVIRGHKTRARADLRLLRPTGTDSLTGSSGARPSLR
ncbi:MAG TPA: hypothetical protein PKW63_09275 [Vicinamibacterales bacterium]|jgi:hypothetical protein|nr:hypothetical protein [Acidobacteriota bacterium]HQX81936.1 hypothetical protein [Vicinamibacterales bacterium]